MYKKGKPHPTGLLSGSSESSLVRRLKTSPGVQASGRQFGEREKV